MAVALRKKAKRACSPVNQNRGDPVAEVKWMTAEELEELETVANVILNEYRANLGRFYEDLWRGVELEPNAVSRFARSKEDVPEMFVERYEDAVARLKFVENVASRIFYSIRHEDFGERFV